MGTDTRSYQPPLTRMRDDTANGPSVALWRKLNHNSLGIDGKADGFELYETFYNWGGLVVSNVGIYGGFKSYEDTGGTLTLRDTSPPTLRMATDDTDNDSVSLQGAGATGRQAVITDTAGSMRQVIQEGRFSFGKITDTFNWFFGLAQPGCAANDGFFSDAGALPDKDLIGFWLTEADGDSIKYGYKKAGQAMQTLGVAQVPVADTMYKFGLLADPSAPPSEKVKFYVNGEVLDVKVTADMIAAATFPDGEGLSLFSEIKNGSGAITTVDCTFLRLSCSPVVA